MKKIDLPFFYKLGAQLHPLTEFDVKASNRLKILIACYRAKLSIEFLLDSFNGLTVCCPAGRELLKYMGKCDKWYDETPDDKLLEPDPSVDYQFQMLISKAKEFETVLSAELQALATYYATQKGIYSTTALIERTENVLPKSVKEKIIEQVIKDIRQSGECLAYDCATASAFHIMRATEVVLHEYYIAVCKPEPIPKKMLKSWGTYIKRLKTVDDSEVKEVVAMLQQIKDRHRNLIMHPEVFLSTDEAFQLFEQAKSAIISMAGRLPELKKE